jgi:mRNA-degrading endonuclease RelE of RelBE toxin-antitoxin system
MRHEIAFAPAAVEDLKRLRAFERAAIRDAIEVHLRHEPRRVSRSRIKRLRGLKRPQYRLRVGQVRVFYDVAPGVVEVLAVIAKPDADRWLKDQGETE